jgi:hypothetical protein
MSKIRHQWTDEEIIQVASHYRHKGEWKRSTNRLHSAAYQAALARPEVFTKATAHMTPKAHPYSGSYIIYAYEFIDHHVYIGLTFTPAIRRSMHMQRGRVFEHAKICSGFTYKILEEKIASPQEAMLRERHWIEQYQTDWTLLNISPGGSLGTIQISKWTKEAVITEARKYSSKQAWIDGSQVSYRLAKREGWFEEASAHMPNRVMGIGKDRIFTAAHRQKLSDAKRGKRQTAAHRAARSKAVKAWWINRSYHGPTASVALPSLS